MLTGGTGADTFVLGTTQTANGTDSITDFSVADGDKLDFFGSTTATVASSIYTFPSGSDLSVSSNNVYFVAGGDGTIGTSSGGGAAFVSTSSGSGNRIVISNNDNAIVLAATSSGATDFNVYRVYDSNSSGTTAAVELLGTVHMTNGTFNSLPGTVNNYIKPAGVAGSPINLALANPTDLVGDITASISGVPAGWAISQGTDNGDGTWTVQTSDLCSAHHHLARQLRRRDLHCM